MAFLVFFATIAVPIFVGIFMMGTPPETIKKMDKKPKMAGCYEKLEELGKLQSNWNGYGALPIEPYVIHKVKYIIERINKVPHICPLSDGGIQLHLVDSEGFEHEFGIWENSIEYYNVETDYEEEIIIVDYCVSLINRL